MKGRVIKTGSILFMLASFALQLQAQTKKPAAHSNSSSTGKPSPTTSSNNHNSRPLKKDELHVYGAYRKGDNLINLGIGLNSYYAGGFPLGVSYERGITDAISVGLGADYLTYKYIGVGFSSTYIGARGSYHFNNLLKLKVEKLDIYAGATVGYRIFSADAALYGSLSNIYSNGIFFGPYAGGKYYFNKSIAGFAELGAGFATNAKLGLGFRF